MTAIMPSREQGAATNFIQGTILGVFLTTLSYAVGIWAGWISSIDWLEAFAVFTSYVCTFLFVMERRICYVVGVVTTVAYCWLFWRFDLNASMAINAFLAVYLAYGWYRWRPDDDTRPITRMSASNWALTAAVTAVGYAIVVALSNAFGGALVWTDAVILVGTLAAQFTLDNKHRETWLLWIIVNVFAIYTYFTTGLHLVGFQYIFFLLNAIWAYSVWTKSYREQGAAEDFRLWLARSEDV